MRPSTACGRSKQAGYDVVMVNNNPETVSTDFDTADRLYFEPLTPEDVLGVIETEKPVRRGRGVRRADGDQADSSRWSRPGVRILGTVGGYASTRRRTASASTQLLEKYGIKRAQGPHGHDRAKKRWRRRTSWATRCWCARRMCWAVRT